MKVQFWWRLQTVLSLATCWYAPMQATLVTSNRLVPTVLEPWLPSFPPGISVPVVKRCRLHPSPKEVGTWRSKERNLAVMSFFYRLLTSSKGTRKEVKAMSFLALPELDLLSKVQITKTNWLVLGPAYRRTMGLAVNF
jgi:hypothetical protein